MLIVFLVLLVAVPRAREKTLKRLANLKDRDEREHYITGKASRAAYLATLSLTILLLFFSIFSLEIYRKPEAEAFGGKRGTVSISLHLNLLDNSHDPLTHQGEVLFESRDFPLSKSAIILLLLGWQLLTFNLAARREEI